MSKTGRMTTSGPVIQMIQGDRVIRYEQLPDGRLRRLVEDERTVFVGYTFVEFNFAQIEMRLAAQLAGDK